MEYKKSMIMIILAVFLFSIAGVSASDVNDTLLASEDAGQMELSSNNEIFEDNLQTCEDNAILAQANDDESVIGETDSQILNAGEGNYSDLRADIENGGSLTKSHYCYRDGDGDTIAIGADMVINGNGAVIDMNGSNIRAFWVFGSGVTIKNLTIKNANYTGEGGAVCFEEQGTITNCNFVDNIASENGGAVYFVDQGTVENCTFTNNSASGAGAVYIFGNGDVTNCTFTNNSASGAGAVYIFGNGDVTNCNFIDNSATSIGGAVSFKLLGSVINCSFVSNSASEGGAIRFGSNGNVANCNFTDNSASGRGVIYFSSNGNVTNCNFVNNSAAADGGAVYFDGQGTVTNCNFTNNQAADGYSRGGAVYIGGNGEVTNCNFTNNTASYGGAIRINSGNVINCKFTDNSASNYGGAIHINSGNVINCNFTKNQVNSGGECGGGAIHINSGNVTNCNFTNNHASNWLGSGGAIQINFGNVTNCKFTDNTASHSGAIRFNSGGAVINCNFTKNKATSGGDSAGAVYFSSEGAVINCNFADNSASAGGAVYFKEQGTVTNCNFTGNYADYGGAIDFEATGNVTNCNFVENTAEVSGGAIFFRGNGNVTNCNFTNNQATSNGNSIYWIVADGKLDNSTFKYSDVSGVEVYLNVQGNVENVMASNCRFENANTDKISTTVSGGTVVNCTLNGIPIEVSAPATNTFAGIQALVDAAGVGGTIVLSGIYAGNGTKINVNKTLTIDGNSSVLDAKGLSGIFDVMADGVVIKNIIFLNGLSSGADGEVVSWHGSNGIMLDCSFINCTSKFVPGVGFNPIVWIGGDNCSIIDSRFVNCPVNLNGAVRWTGTGGSVVNCSFDNCSGESGHSIYWGADNGIISDSSFIYYAVNGVEVNIDANNVTVSNSRFKSSNGDSSTSPVLGGIIVNCTFVGTSLLDPEMTISASDIFLGENETVIVNLKGDADGEVTFTLYEGDEFISTTASDITGGIAVYELSNLALGVYRIEAEYSGDSNYNSTSASTIFIVRPYANITQNVVVGNTVDIAIDLVNATGKIRVFVDGDESSLGDIIANRFQTTLSTYDLSYGSHAVTFKYIGKSLDANVFSRWDDRTNTFVPYEYEMNLAPIEVIETPDVVDSDDGGIIILRVSDSNSTGTVNVRIYLEGYFGVYKEFVVDVVNGIAIIDVSDCKDGSYRIVVTYSGDSKHAGFTKESVAVIHNSPSAILANDANMVYTSNDEYYAIVLAKTGRGIAGVSVSFYLNGKYYGSAATNANGVAGIKISNAPGTYKITSSAGTLSITKTLKVTHLLSLKKVNVKKSAKKLVLTATLKKVNGKYLKNKKITFKFNGKKYTAKTNKKGVAKVTIKKAVLKKLKAGKKVTYQATYLKDTVKYSLKVKK